MKQFKARVYFPCWYMAEALVLDITAEDADAAHDATVASLMEADYTAYQAYEDIEIEEVQQ